MLTGTTRPRKGPLLRHFMMQEMERISPALGVSVKESFQPPPRQFHGGKSENLNNPGPTRLSESTLPTKANDVPRLSINIG